jgi:hypothetical protein
MIMHKISHVQLQRFLSSYYEIEKITHCRHIVLYSKEIILRKVIVFEALFPRRTWEPYYYLFHLSSSRHRYANMKYTKKLALSALKTNVCPLMFGENSCYS